MFSFNWVSRNQIEHKKDWFGQNSAAKMLYGSVKEKQTIYLSSFLLPVKWRGNGIVSFVKQTYYTESTISVLLLLLLTLTRFQLLANANKCK